MGNKYSADQIKVFSGLEAVRKRHSMYIGGTDPKGLHQMFNEVIDNSVEEAIAGFCDKIEVVLIVRLRLKIITASALVI